MSTIEALETEIEELRREIEVARGGQTGSEDARLVELSVSSLKKVLTDRENDLYLARKERACEVLSLRLVGIQVEDGTIELRLLQKILTALGAMLEQSSWRAWDREGRADALDEKFLRQIDLRFAGIQRGSVGLQVIGNTSPDLTGESALDQALRRTFALLGADASTSLEYVNEIGVRAARSLCDLVQALERERLTASLQWRAPGQQVFSWNGTLGEVTRVRALLEDIGEVQVAKQIVTAEVRLLSLGGRIELQELETHRKIAAHFSKAIAGQIRPLRLGDRARFTIETTTYSMAASRRKRDAYRILDVDATAVP